MQTAFWRHHPGRTLPASPAGGHAVPTARAAHPARRGRAARQQGVARRGTTLAGAGQASQGGLG
jgi:hypothetical protein